MSQYVVVTPEGRRFGPTDFQTLSKWAREGRVAPEMTVEDMLSGVSMTAAGVPGLFDADSEVSAPPTRQEPQVQPNYANGSLILGLVGTVGWCLPIFGLLIGIGAIVLGMRSLQTADRTRALIGLVLGIFCVLMHVGITIVLLVLLQQ